MRFLLGAHRARLAARRIEQPRLLVDLAAVLDDRDLAARLDLDRLADEADGVDVLDFAPGAERVSGAAHGDIDVGAQIALLHVAVARADVAQNGAQLADIGLRLLSRAHVGLGDDLHQADPRAVEIDETHRRRLVVQGLAGVLLEMKPLDPDPDGMVGGEVDMDFPLADDRALVLGYLIALGQVGIEIILAVEGRTEIDPGLEPEAGAHRLSHAFAVDDRQHARHRRIDQRDMRVGLAAERRRSAGEQLRARRHLSVDLETDDHFPIARRALDEVCASPLCRHADDPHVIRTSSKWAPAPHSHHGSGSAVRPPDCSIVSPSANSVSSSNGRPMSCSPSGRPSLERPAGATSPGRPAMLTVTVKTSLRYISTGFSDPFSPIPNAADGVAGVRIASTPSAKTRSKSRLMRVRIFCART